MLAVSPIIGGNAVKGPLAKMYHELGIQSSSTSVAKHYREIIRGMVIDQGDVREKAEIEAFGIIIKSTNILMKDADDRKRLARDTIDFGKTIT